MWKALKSTTGNVYMIKWNRNEQEFIFYITDLKSIWTAVSSIECIAVKFQELNPLFDLKPDEAVSQVQNMFEGINQANVDVATNNLMLNLNVEMNLSGSVDPQIKTRYEIELVEAENEKFTEMITIAMIQTIHFLETQQKMLCNLLEKKDRELEEYQMEKGAISRSDLITEKFDPSPLEPTSQKLVLNVFGNSKDFMDKINSDYGKPEENILQVEVESWNAVKKKRKIYNSESALTSKNTKIIYKSNKL